LKCSREETEQSSDEKREESAEIDGCGLAQRRRKSFPSEDRQTQWHHHEETEGVRALKFPQGRQATHNGESGDANEGKTFKPVPFRQTPRHELISPSPKPTSSGFWNENPPKLPAIHEPKKIQRNAAIKTLKKPVRL
jgi:hypothetical protein